MSCSIEALARTNATDELRTVIQRAGAREGSTLCEGALNAGLCAAAKAGRLEACAVLLEAGANPHSSFGKKNALRRSALQLAVVQQHLSVVQLLSKWGGGQPDQKQTEETRALARRKDVHDALYGSGDEAEVLFGYDKNRHGWIWSEKKTLCSGLSRAFFKFGRGDDGDRELEMVKTLSELAPGCSCCQPLYPSLLNGAVVYELGFADLSTLYNHQTRVHIDKNDLAQQICTIVSTIHAAGFAWLDIKPQNLICFWKGQEEEEEKSNVKVLLKATDLGGCILLGEAVRREAIQCTARYACPELASTDSFVTVTPQLDYWALGMTLLVLYCGPQAVNIELESEFGLCRRGGESIGGAEEFLGSKFLRHAQLQKKLDDVLDGLNAPFIVRKLLRVDSELRELERLF